jgi:hypothetical protein
MNLKFTGKATLLIELEEYGPIEFRVNDLDTVMELTKTLLKQMNSITIVDSYNKREEKKLRQMLNF